MWENDEFEDERDEDDEWDLDYLLQQKYGTMYFISPGGPVADVKFDANASLLEKQAVEAFAKAIKTLSPTEIIKRLEGKK